MPIRVSPKEPNPTHHIALQDRRGRVLGLTLCNEDGTPIKNARGAFNKIAVETTAQKQTSGSSSYNDYQYPYSPIVQDDLSGGRGNLDFERDSTRYFDSFRTLSARANKAYAGPQEQWTSGLRAQVQHVPGNVMWHKLHGEQRYIYTRFQSSEYFPAALLWVIARRKGQPGALTLAIHNDSAGNVGDEVQAVEVPYTRMADTLSEWLCEPGEGENYLSSSSYYWFVVYASADDDEENHWLLGVESGAGSTYSSEDFDGTPPSANVDLYYRVTTANEDTRCIMFPYKEQMYFVVSPESGAPSLYMAGDRGVADSNAGNLNRLVDATKTWTTNQFAGKIVKIIDGTGATEEEPWRTIIANGSTYLTVSSPWITTHDTTTEYVILDDSLTEITGHGLTAPVTDVMVSPKGVIYFAQGDSVNIRRAKFERSGAAWTPSYADDGTNKAYFLKYKPQEQKIVKANQRDASNNTSIALDDVPDWGTDLTFDTAKNIGSKYVRITGLEIYPDEDGDEAIVVFTEEIPYVVSGSDNPKPITIPEMRVVRSQYNGRGSLAHNVYLYFPLGAGGLERYYGTTLDDIGPNRDEGLPSGRRGVIAALAGYPGSVFAAVDAGSSGYSSVLQSGGWHERYRAPYRQRILAMHFQPIPGNIPDRLWVYQGNDLIWLPFPSDTTNELEDENYKHTHEFAVVLARMHAGLFDVQKLVRKIKLQTEDLEVVGDSGVTTCWFELDYRLDDDTEWTQVDTVFTESPTQEYDFLPQYGLAGKRLQFRLRGYTADATKTPVLLAIVINAVLRTDVKYMYQTGDFRVMDDEPLLSTHNGTPEQEHMKATDKMKLIEDWADADSDSMLKMRSVSPLFHDKVVFINPPQWRQVLFRQEEGNTFGREVYIGRVTFQEA